MNLDAVIHLDGSSWIPLRHQNRKVIELIFQVLECDNWDGVIRNIRLEVAKGQGLKKCFDLESFNGDQTGSGACDSRESENFGLKPHCPEHQSLILKVRSLLAAGIRE